MKITRLPIAFILLLATTVVYAQTPSAVQIFMPDGSRPERELRFERSLTDSLIASIIPT